MMSSRFTLSALCLWLACGGLAPAQAPTLAGATGCANPRLPLEILDGAPQHRGGKPLAVVDVRGEAVTLRMAVAADETTRELGLMCVIGMRPHAGMIFVFDDDGPEEFWMKHTLIPLDMVWVASDGTVRDVASSVPASTLQTPDDRVARRSGNGRYVLELQAGEARADGIAKGARLIIPLLEAT
jgi:uncharacterized membrane protein (UPF0127 family)